MTNLVNAELDIRILRALDRSESGSMTAWAIAQALPERRERISDRLKALKRAGLVTCQGMIWSRARAEVSA